MKKLLFLFVLSLCSLAAWAYDFSAAAPTGQTLYFNIISETNRTVGVVLEPYRQPTGDLEIPSTVAHNGTTYTVTELTNYQGYGSFNDALYLTSVIIPNTVTSIGNYAFANCIRLVSVTLPNSIQALPYSAFFGCRSLVNISIPNTVTTIGSIAFSGCRGLASLTIPNSVTSIGSDAFSDVRVVNYCGSASGRPWGSPHVGCGFCEEGDFIYQDGTKTTLISYVGSSSRVTIPNSVTSIGSHAFYNCSSLESVTIPNSVISIGSQAFYNCSSLESVTIPNSMTTIGAYAFQNCSGLTSVTFGNSLANIKNNAFDGCSELTSVTIPNSVTSIGNNAFSYCYNLKTVYNLSNLSITKGDYVNGRVAYYANRVVSPSTFGSGANTIYQIPATFSFVDVEDNVETNIPRATIPNMDNLIYNDGGWKAKNIVLTDGQDAFEAPETFTAETATYIREFTNSNRSTLYLPFTASVPSGLEVYDFTSFANNTISFTEHTGDIDAYTPYLVGYDLSKDGNTTTCTITKTNAVFPKSESANYHPVTHNDMTFSGVISRTQMTSTNNYGYSNGFFVQSGGSAHVNPFRCYFTYTPSSDAPQTLPPSLNVEVGYGDPVGIDAVETPEQEYDGRYGKDVYDMLGRLVRKNATNLEGLPRGIYIWKGKKIMNYDL